MAKKTAFLTKAEDVKQDAAMVRKMEAKAKKSDKKPDKKMGMKKK
jgi:hypothetical protein